MQCVGCAMRMLAVRCRCWLCAAGVGCQMQMLVVCCRCWLCDAGAGCVMQVLHDAGIGCVLQVLVVWCRCWLCDAGVGADPGPSSPCTCGGSQECQGVVHQGAQDQGHLPHPQHVQPGRHPQVPHRRVLVSGGRP